MTRSLLLTATLGLALVACGDKDDDTGGGGEYAAILALEGDVDAGQEVFVGTCSGCHGADGSGGTGPDLNDHAPHHTDSDILDIVFNGQGSMPGFTLTDQEAADLLAYFRASFG